MFILTDKAIKAIINTPGLKAKLQLALNVSENSIYRFYNQNLVNGDLTKLAAREVLLKETGLTDKQLYEKIAVPV